MQEACAFKLHNAFLVSVLFNTHYHQPIIATLIGILCMTMSIGILLKKKSS